MRVPPPSPAPQSGTAMYMMMVRSSSCEVVEDLQLEVRDLDSGVGFAAIFHTDLQVEVSVGDREVAGHVRGVDAMDVRMCCIDSKYGHPSPALLE